jgi:hypothetical protein
MATAAIDFSALLKDVPRGAWVAISEDRVRLLAYGAEMREVLASARSQGEDNPVIYKVPEQNTGMFF